MPDITGRLYPSERDALKPKVEPKKKTGRPRKNPLPAPVVPAPAVPKANMAEGLAKVAKTLGAVEVARNGKPLKATPERIAAITDAIARGLTIDKSCILHGVSRSMLDKWKKANADVLQLFEQAELKAELDLVDKIQRATASDWKAANWLLERRHQWEQRSKTELTGKDGGALAVLSVQKALFSNVSTAPDARSKARSGAIEL